MTQNGKAWIVTPAGAAGAGVAGTFAEPWSFAYAATGADGRIRPGHTVWLRAGTYRSEEGFTIGFSGAPGYPVTWKAAPGERFELDGAIPAFIDASSTAWEPVSAEPGHNLYRSTAAYPRSFLYGGFINIDGQWLPLAPHKTTDADDHFTRDWIESDHHDWRHPEPYYLGPGICHDPTAVGRLYVRLACIRKIRVPDSRTNSRRIDSGDIVPEESQFLHRIAVSRIEGGRLFHFRISMRAGSVSPLFPDPSG